MMPCLLLPPASDDAGKAIQGSVELVGEGKRVGVTGDSEPGGQVRAHRSVVLSGAHVGAKRDNRASPGTADVLIPELRVGRDELPHQPHATLIV